VAAASQALELDFIPLFDEHYELVIRREFLDTPLLAPLFELTHNDEFRRSILALPGYDISQIGMKIADLG
jgi:putative molybdopterin biosynthesis protein